MLLFSSEKLTVSERNMPWLWLFLNFFSMWVSDLKPWKHLFLNLSYQDPVMSVDKHFCMAVRASHWSGTIRVLSSSEKWFYFWHFEHLVAGRRKEEAVYPLKTKQKKREREKVESKLSKINEWENKQTKSNFFITLPSFNYSNWVPSVLNIFEKGLPVSRNSLLSMWLRLFPSLYSGWELCLAQVSEAHIGEHRRDSALGFPQLDTALFTGRGDGTKKNGTDRCLQNS